MSEHTDTAGNILFAVKRDFTRRMWLSFIFGGCVLFFAVLFTTNVLIGDAGLETDLSLRKLPPSQAHWLGTDWLGRDMFTRTIKGLCLSLQIGMLAAGISVVISVVLGMLSATMNRKVDLLVTGAIDLMMSMPHLVLLILVSFVLGGGARGVIFAVAISHWPRLARIIRAEVLQLQQVDYVLLSKRLGRPSLWIARHHLLPHLVPQFLVGLILLFPHAILHAASLTFLGFGLSPNHPSIGVLLSESMRHLSTGYWWLAIFPGAGLVFTVKMFDMMGSSLRCVLDPITRQE
jgi:peptide/nickel transport system permease protein